MITLTNIEKVYRTDRIETVALSNVNLTVGEGEFVSVMGPSGCGKSTLHGLMGLLDVPTRGTIALGGPHLRGAGLEHHPHRRRAGGLGHQPQPGRAGDPRSVPRGSPLPPQPHRRAPAPAARAAGGTSRGWPAASCRRSPSSTAAAT